MTEALQVGQFCCLSSHDLHTQRASSRHVCKQLQRHGLSCCRREHTWSRLCQG